MARQKQVFKTDEIPHLWAHQTQHEARNAQGNLFFEGDTIYSYRSNFPIARHVRTKIGDAVFLTTNRYSVTTSGHIYSVNRAIPDGLPVFHLDASNWGTTHGAVLEYREKITKLEREAARAKSNADYKLSQLAGTVDEARAYCAAFGIEETFELRTNMEDVKVAITQERKAETARKKRAIAEAQEKVTRWLNGEDINLPRLDRIYLRIVGDQVESSHGAVFPVSHARLGYRVIRRVIASGQPWHRNGEQIRLGYYNVDSIDARGNVKAGCHSVRFEDIERIAAALS